MWPEKEKESKNYFKRLPTMIAEAQIPLPVDKAINASCFYIIPTKLAPWNNLDIVSSYIFLKNKNILQWEIHLKA